jgi:hypothetical protein
MHVLDKRKRVAVGAIRRALNLYGAFKHSQGRLSAGRSRGKRATIAAAAGGLALGIAAGTLLGRKLGGGHDHDHEHHTHAGDVPTASAERQSDASPVSNGALSPALTT